MKSENEIRILWITERFPPLSGGMAVSAERQVEGLRKTGMEIDVLVFVPHDDAVSIKRHKQDGGSTIFVRHPDEYGNASQRAWREIFSQNSVRQYDLVFGFGAGFPGYVAVTFAAWLGVPSMVSVRGNDFDRDWFEPKKSFFVKEALERADGIATVTTEKREKIMALFPGKNVFWSPNGIDTGFFDLLPDEKEECRQLRTEMGTDGRRIIGIFGELKYKKRVPMWLSAVREAELNDKFSLIVAGKMDAKTDALLKDPVLSPAVKHFSFRSQEKLPPVYAACDFIAIPSLFEGFPNVLLEAMASGCIPIVSDAGAMKDVIIHGKTGFLFQAENRIEAGEATKAALALSDDALKEMKNAVKEYVREQYSIENEISVLKDRIADVVGKKK